MRRDLLLLVAVFCSLLDRCAARLAHCFRDGRLTPPTPKTPRRLASQSPALGRPGLNGQKAVGPKFSAPARGVPVSH